MSKKIRQILVVNVVRCIQYTMFVYTVHTPYSPFTVLSVRPWFTTTFLVVERWCDEANRNRETWHRILSRLSCECILHKAELSTESRGKRNSCVFFFVSSLQSLAFFEHFSYYINKHSMCCVETECVAFVCVYRSSECFPFLTATRILIGWWMFVGGDEAGSWIVHGTYVFVANRLEYVVSSAILSIFLVASTPMFYEKQLLDEVCGCVFGVCANTFNT